MMAPDALHIQVVISSGPLVQLIGTAVVYLQLSFFHFRWQCRSTLVLVVNIAVIKEVGRLDL